jgi:hypothetical protein
VRDRTCYYGFGSGASHSDNPCAVEMQAPNNNFWTFLVGSVDRGDPVVQIVTTIMGEMFCPFLLSELLSEIDGRANLVERNKKLFLFEEEAELEPRWW